MNDDGDNGWLDELPALVQAAARGDVDQAAELVRTGTDPCQGDEGGWTALHAAAVFNHGEIVRVLLRAGADVDARDDDGFTPLLNAAEAGADVVTVLLDAGADPLARDDTFGWRPLDRFAGYGNAEALRLVLDAGADVDARTSYGTTALMNAAEAGSTDCVVLLLHAGADRSVIHEGETAADLAAKHGHHALARVLATPSADNRAVLDDTAR